MKLILDPEQYFQIPFVNQEKGIDHIKTNFMDVQKIVRGKISELKLDELKGHLALVEDLLGRGIDLSGLGISLLDMKSYKSKLISEMKKRKAK